MVDTAARVICEEVTGQGGTGAGLQLSHLPYAILLSSPLIETVSWWLFMSFKGFKRAIIGALQWATVCIMVKVNNWLKSGCQAYRLNNCYGLCTYYLGAARLMWMEFTRNKEGSFINEFTEEEQSCSSRQDVLILRSTSGTQSIQCGHWS